MLGVRCARQCCARQTALLLCVFGRVCFEPWLRITEPLLPFLCSDVTGPAGLERIFYTLLRIHDEIEKGDETEALRTQVRVMCALCVRKHSVCVCACVCTCTCLYAYACDSQGEEKNLWPRTSDGAGRVAAVVLCVIPPYPIGVTLARPAVSDGTGRVAAVVLGDARTRDVQRRQQTAHGVREAAGDVRVHRGDHQEVRRQHQVPQHCETVPG